MTTRLDRSAPLFDGVLPSSRSAGRLTAGSAMMQDYAVRLLLASDASLHFEVAQEAADLVAATHISPESFAQLKSEQNLHVEFDRFSSHVVALLRQCEEAHYRLHVDWQRDVVTVTVFESTEFRDLAHLTLRLNVASEEGLRSYLWQRLRQEAERGSRLQVQLSERQSEMAKLRDDVERALEETRAVKRAAEADRLEFASSVERRREEALRRARLEVADEERNRRDRAEARVVELEARLRASDDECAQLRKAKAELEVVAMRESGANDAIGPVRAECAELRARCRELESRAFEEAARAARLQESAVRVEREIAAKDEATSRLAELLRAERLNGAAQATLVDELRASVHELKRAVAEQKDAMEAQAAQLRDAEAKAARSASVIRAQERLVRERTEQLDAARLKASEVPRLESTVEQLSTRLEDCLNTIEANKTVIAYLSKAKNPFT